MKFYLQVAILLLFPHLLFCQSVEQDYQELVDDIYLHRYLFDTAYNASLGTRISIDSERSNTTEPWHFSTSFSGVYSNLVFGVINLDPVDTFRIRSLDDTFLDDISLSLEYKRHGSISSNRSESYSSIKDDNSPSKPPISGTPFHINRIEGEYWIAGTNSIDVRCMYNEAFALGYRNEGQSFLFAYESPDFFGEEVELEYRGIQKIRIDLIDLKEL